jgi:hypothetical protein
MTENEEILLRCAGMTFHGFYHAFREACRPPMVNIETLEVGELWFYCGLSAAVTACLGEKSLLVAYDTYGPREKVITDFQSAHAWLRGERPDLPGNLHLVFAAFEEPSGELRVRRFAPGDWMGIPSNVPLPPTEQQCPSGWGE